MCSVHLRLQLLAALLRLLVLPSVSTACALSLLAPPSRTSTLVHLNLSITPSLPSSSLTVSQSGLLLSFTTRRRVHQRRHTLHLTISPVSTHPLHLSAVTVSPSINCRLIVSISTPPPSRPAVVALAHTAPSLDLTTTHSLSLSLTSASQRARRRLRLNLPNTLLSVPERHLRFSQGLFHSTFQLPPLAPVLTIARNVSWTLEEYSQTNSTVFVYQDRTEATLPFAPRPIILAIHPSRIPEGRDAIVLVLGRFAIQSSVRVGNSIPTVFQQSPNHLVLFLPAPTLRAGNFSISVQSFGLLSQPASLTVAAKAPRFALSLLGLSHERAALLPSACGVSSAVVLSRVPRASGSLSLQAFRLSGGTLVALNSSLLRTPLLQLPVVEKPEFVLVRSEEVDVVLFVKPRNPTILPLSVSATRSSAGRAILRMSTMANECFPRAKLRVRWTVDNDSLSEAHAVWETGLATTVVSRRAGFTFQTVVEAVGPGGAVLARAQTRARVEDGGLSNRLVLNGGASGVVLPAGQRMMIRVGMVGDAAEVDFEWSCTRGNGTDCPDVLFPRPGSVTMFEANAEGLPEDVIVVYVVTARTLRGGWVGKATLRLKVGVSDSKQFPPATLTSGASGGMLETRRKFNCHDVLTLKWGEAVPTNFGLVRDGVGEDDVLSRALLTLPGFWSQDTQKGTLLGLKTSALSTGRYTLRGRRTGSNSRAATSEWTFSIAPCPRVTLADLRQSILRNSAFRATAYATTRTGQLYTYRYTIHPDGEQPETRMLPTIPKMATCPDGCPGTPDALLATPPVGKYALVVDLYDARGALRLATARSPISSAGTDTAVATTVGLSSKLSTALRWHDEGALLRELLTAPTNASIGVKTQEEVHAALARIADTPGQPVFRAAAVISACTVALRLTTILSSSLSPPSALLRAVESAVSSSIPGAPTAELLHTPLSIFFANASSRPAAALAANSSNGAALAALVTVRESAARAVPAALATGLPCGATARLTVTLWEDLVDDHRVGIDCFRGQTRGLPPAPELFTRCDVARRAVLTTPIVIATSALPDLGAPAGMVRSAVVRTRFLQVGSRQGRAVVTASTESGGCFSADVTIPMSRLAERDGAPTSLSCPGAGSVVTRGEGAAGKSVGERQSLPVLRVDGGKVVANVRREEAGSVQMEVNTSALAGCANEVAGEGQGVVVAVAAGVGGTLALLAMVGFLLVLTCARGEEGSERFSVPASAAGVHVGSLSLTRSTVGSERQSDELGGNEWEAEYQSLRAGGGTRGGGRKRGRIEGAEEMGMVEYGGREVSEVTGSDGVEWHSQSLSMSMTLSADSTMDIGAWGRWDGDSVDSRSDASEMENDYYLADEFGRRCHALSRYTYSRGGIVLDAARNTSRNAGR